MTDRRTDFAIACSKSERHCLHHILPLRSSISQMTVRPRGHSYDVLRGVYDLTKRSFILRSLYEQKSVLLQFLISVVNC